MLDSSPEFAFPRAIFAFGPTGFPGGVSVSQWLLSFKKLILTNSVDQSTFYRPVMFAGGFRSVNALGGWFPTRDQRLGSAAACPSVEAVDDLRDCLDCPLVLNPHSDSALDVKQMEDLTVVHRD